MIPIEYSPVFNLLFDAKGITHLPCDKSIYKLPDDAYVCLSNAHSDHVFNQDLEQECIGAAERGRDVLYKWVMATFEIPEHIARI